MTVDTLPLPPQFGSEPPTSGTTNIHVTDSPSPRHGLGRGSHIIRPSWQIFDKRPRFFPISITVSNINFSNKKLMPLSINNSSPSVQLHVGTTADDGNKERVLVDKGAAMNTGNTNYHQGVMSQYSSMVAEYFECGPGTEYNVAQILAALDLKGIHQPVDQGSTTTVILYNTPYIINNDSLLILSFALGTDVVLRSILDIPSLLAMGLVVGLAKGKLVCSELNREFMLQFYPLGTGILDGDTLDYISTVVPNGVPSNIPTLGCLSLQYTAFDYTITLLSHTTYFSNIVVKDCFFQGFFHVS